MASKTIGQVIAEGGLKRFMDRRLIKALAHPVREHILAVLNERVASPSEIGKEIGLSVETFHHHIEVLEEFGCIERVKTMPRRGATEHFYRASMNFLIDDSQWEEFPETLKSAVSANITQEIFGDVLIALRNETFDSRRDRHASWLPVYLDEQGLQEQLLLLNETLDRSIAIHESSARRLATTGERGTRWTTGILGFEMPSPATTR
jgi:predicted ArsR family transcriptional regulator